MNLNKVIIVGRIGRDPEMKATPSGATVTSFSLATSKNWKDKNGEKQEQTEWHNVVFWNKPAEIIAQYVKKGDLLLVEGRIQTRTYEKDGVKMYRTEIIGEQFQFGTKANNDGDRDTRSQADKDFDEMGGDQPPATSKPAKKKGASTAPVEEGDINPEDIPF